MRLVAKAPCKYGGKRYYSGDDIPVDFVIDPKTQEEMGLLTIVSDGEMEGAADGFKEQEESPTVINVPIITKDGAQTISVAPESVSTAIYVMQLKQDEAIEEISKTSDDDMLLIVDACENNTKIRAAIRNRIDVLRTEKEAEGTEESEGGV